MHKSSHVKCPEDVNNHRGRGTWRIQNWEVTSDTILNKNQINFWQVGPQNNTKKEYAWMQFGETLAQCIRTVLRMLTEFELLIRAAHLIHQKQKAAHCTFREFDFRDI